jgi:SAM-dependent methyltransferase
VSIAAWDHNAYYHRLVLAQLPHHCERVLDVGCGAGFFAEKLAKRATEVVALDESPVMIRSARQATPGNVTCVEADVMQTPLPSESYDAITSISVLHHLPLEEALCRFSDALRPGGVLVAISLPRADLPRELPTELAAVVINAVTGLTLMAARRTGVGNWLAPGDADMPVREPVLTTAEVRLRAVGTTRCASAAPAHVALPVGLAKAGSLISRREMRAAEVARYAPEPEAS